jgi:hypothetical protein
MKNTHPIQAYYEGLVEPIYRTVSGTVLHLAMFEGAETREAATTRTKTFLAARLCQNCRPRPQLSISAAGMAMRLVFWHSAAAVA